MQPLGKDQNISCFQEPLTSVRLGRVYVKRTERNPGTADLLLPHGGFFINPRGTGILTDNNVPVLTHVGPQH